MIRHRKKQTGLLCYAVLFALLLLMSTPSLLANAADWSSDNIKPGTTLTEGDTIVYADNQIEITYNCGTLSTTENADGNLKITEKTNGSTVFKKYLVSTVSYSENKMSIIVTGIPVPEYELQSLIIKSAPKKTTYLEGESFNNSGMVVTACYSNNNWEDVTDYKITPSGALKASDTRVTISYTDNRNVTKSTTQNITVNPKDPNSYIISARAAAGGSISDTGNSSVKRGDGKTYTISPNNGYRINYVEVDGNIVGAVSSYTFDNVQENHSISAYFLLDSAAGQNNASKKKLSVVGSFSGTSGAGAYLPGTKVTIDAGTVPGFAFAGWIASDGIVYPMPTMSYVMPAYDVLLYANWVQSGTPNAFSQITTTNLKEPQLSNWTDIANKLATFNKNDLTQPGNPVMKVAIGGITCYVDAAPIAMLNTRQGTALEIFYGNDASFTFYSDVDNSQFMGTDLSYTCSTGTNLFFHEKSLVFTQPGAINTGICLNVALPDAQPGQLAYVYLVNESGAEIMYLPVIVDAEQKVSIPISAKVNLNIKY